MSLPRCLASFWTIVLSSASLFAQVKEPPRAAKLEVNIHYRIRAERDDRIRQFRALESHLKALGFDDAKKDDPAHALDVFDPSAERFTGTIASDKVLQILNDPHVIGLVFAPAGYTYPDTGDKPVSVRVVLREGLHPNAQQALHLQALAQLEQLGFKDALAYDTRSHTQLKGTIPYKSLERLSNDLRTEPAGWFALNTPLDRLPRPFADRSPVRWVEVMPAVEPPAVFAPERVLPARARLTPDLRARLMDPAAKDAPMIVEVIFESSVDDRLEDFRRRLDTHYGPAARRGPDGKPAKGPDGRPLFTDGAVIEGAIGNVAAIRFDGPAEMEKFSQEPDVLSVRLPARGVETAAPSAGGRPPAAAAELLRSSGVDALHKLGYTGAGVKVIVVGTDFTGAEKLIGATLPRKTRILDLTTELNTDILPLPADGSRAAANLAVARAVAVAAPGAELVLVRIDPQSFFQLRGIVRVARGDTAYSTAMRSRLIDLSRRSEALTYRKDQTVEEYRRAFEDLADDEPTRVRRARARAAFEAVLVEQRELTARINRFNALQSQVTDTLTGARVIVNPLVWEAGYPLDSISELSRLLEEYAVPPPPRTTRPATGPRATRRPPVVWVQSASPSVGSVWAGHFTDADRNGTIEFAPPTRPFAAGNWSHELNFLGVTSPAGEVTPELPAGAKLRFTVQWREPRDTRLPGLDIPAYPVVLRLFRQLDPAGEKRPSDEMGEEARSAGGPYPILRTATTVVYEQVLEFTVPAAGRYAFVIAMGYQPEAILPALKREVEITPRLVVETLGAKPGDGRVVFRSYSTRSAGVGVPADSRGVVTVGVPDGGSMTSGGIGVTLLVKPDLLGPEALDGGESRGPGVATGYAAGIAAALVQADAAGMNVFQSAGVTPGQLPVISGAWLRYLRPAPRAGVER